MSLLTAVEDLQFTLEQSAYLDRVDDINLAHGSSNLALTMAYGAQEHEAMFGKTKIYQTIELTLVVKIKLPTGKLAEITRAIDDEIIDDRRRSGLAQTTVLTGGWDMEADEGKGPSVLTREIEVHCYESQI